MGRVALRTQGHERYHLGRLKVVADGSIQGFTARLLPPRTLVRWLAAQKSMKPLSSRLV